MPRVGARAARAATGSAVLVPLPAVIANTACSASPTDGRADACIGLGVKCVSPYTMPAASTRDSCRVERRKVDA
jgi:hypothetical protein